MNFSGKVAVVTGGLSGIGRAVVSRLAAEGAHTVVFDAGDVSRDDGLSAHHVLSQLPTKALFVKGDVGEPAEVEAAFRQRCRPSVGWTCSSTTPESRLSSRSPS